MVCKFCCEIVRLYREPTVKLQILANKFDINLRLISEKVNLKRKIGNIFECIDNNYIIKCLNKSSIKLDQNMIFELSEYLVKNNITIFKSYGDLMFEQYEMLEEHSINGFCTDILMGRPSEFDDDSCYYSESFSDCDYY
jgi:hypothetical protein